MNELMNQVSPNYTLVLWIILSGLFVAGTYLIIKRILFPILPLGKLRNQILTRTRHMERLFWPLYSLLLAVSFIICQPLAGLALSIFLTAIFWSMLKDFYHGLFLRADKKYLVGQRVCYEEHNGTIKAFGNRVLILELESGGLLDIPYSKFTSAILMRTSPKSGIVSHTFEISISKPCDLLKEKHKIQSKLITMPWVLPNQKILIEHLGEDDSRHNLRVTIHGIDKNHLYKVESQLKGM